MDKTAIALGTFDGVHIGHLAVIEATANSGFKPIAVTFSKPPKAFFDRKIKCLTTLKQKDKKLRDSGIKEIYYIDFQSVREMSALDFLEYLKTTYNCAYISCGYNYRFGKEGSGDIALLTEFCEKNSIILNVAKEVKVGDTAVSSTKIRALLTEGNVGLANQMLGYNFGFSAPVIHGDARGRKIGFPTANQLYPKDILMVRHGVYKSLIRINGKTYKGITNIGHRPTYKTQDALSETHIIDFYDDIYGYVADLQIIQFIRDEKKFDSKEELKAAINNDLNK